MAGWTMAAALGRMALCALLTGLLGAALPAAAQQGPYRYAVPAGWTRSADAGAETLVPSAEPAGTAQALLLAPKPLAGEFDAQFDAERAALESHWGLQRPQATPPQRGRTAAGPYAAHFASYASDGGPRYMSFLAIGRNGQFAMLVFVATTDEAFNRLAPQVTGLWQGLQLGP
jgi:hypothetical protein